MKPSILLFCIALLFVAACSEDTNRDCEVNKYGTAHFVFTGPELNHRVIIHYPDSAADYRQTDFSATNRYDTLHLPVGDWGVKLYSIDSTNHTVATGTAQLNTQQCSNDTITVDF